MRETRTIEFKEAVTNTFLKTVSAFANYGTGRIFFGVRDDGTVAGLGDLDSVCLSIENRINDGISPTPEFSLEPNAKTGVVVLTVREGLHKPYLYRAKAYRRGDTSTVEVDRLELARLVMEGQNLSFEDTDARERDLTFSVLESGLSEKMGISAVSHDVLRTLELERPDGTHNVAGELLADRNSFPGIDAVRFGDSISVLLDRQTFERESILSQFESMLGMFRRYYEYEEVSGADRVARESIPEAAFREGIANALVHRQWDVPSHIRVSMFADRVEIASPGGLPHGLSEEEFLNSQISMLRNPILGNVFFRLGIIERFGTGVLRIRDAYRDSQRQPSFEVFPNSIKVTLPTVEEKVPVPGDAGKVLRAVRGRELAISDVTAATGFGKTKAQQLLRSLASDGYVSITGRGRGTRYSA